MFGLVDCVLPACVLRFGTDSARGHHDQSAEDEKDAQRQENGTADVATEAVLFGRRCIAGPLLPGVGQRGHERSQSCEERSEDEETHGREGVVEGFVLPAEQDPSGRTLHVSVAVHHSLQSRHQLLH